MLKFLAVVTMLVDHIGAVFFPGNIWWRIVGRFAFPLFAFCIARGFAHSRDLGKYLRLLAIFALVSQAPFSWMMHVGGRDPVRGSIMVTWLVAMALLLGLVDPPGRHNPLSHLNHAALRAVARAALVVGACTAAVLLPMDYRWYGVVFPVVIYFVWFTEIIPAFWRYPALIAATIGLTFIMIHLRQSSDVQYYAVTAIAALPLLLRYERLVRLPRLFFYWFYPVHIAALVGLASIAS